MMDCYNPRSIGSLCAHLRVSGHQEIEEDNAKSVESVQDYNNLS